MANEITKSGYHIANTLALVMLRSCEDILGTGGIKTILTRAHLSDLIDHYPPDNLAKEFDYADYTGIMVALEDIYGPRGGRIMGLRIGRGTRLHMYNKFGPMFGFTNIAFKVLPPKIKLRLAITAMSKLFNRVTDQHTRIVENEDSFDYVVDQCPLCWGRSGLDSPVCYATVGLIKGGLNLISNGREYDIKEITCHAMGDEYCTFRIIKEPIA